MSNLRFTDSALSEWMRGNGQDSDIVISTRVRVARNLRIFLSRRWQRISSQEKC